MKMLNEIKISKCDLGCCIFKIKKYDTSIPEYYYGPKKKKAGVFVYDKINNKVLLVQSKGRLYGFPKGSLNIGENSKKGAIRELKEETGVDIDIEKLGKMYLINNNAYYYLLDINLNKVYFNVQIKDIYNDANACIGIKIECLKKLIKSKKIKLNNHCIKLLKIVLNINIFK